MYDEGTPTADEASPLLLPLGVGLLVLGVCVAAAALLIPWDAIPAPVECHDVAVKGLLGRVKDVRQVCTTDTSLSSTITFAVVLVSAAMAALAVVFTLRSLTRSGRGSGR